eukprot:TRINITY_DN6906_c0_g1_i1.p1 TRINITY_DN6906_c0_g1~~TRINITY_DN6906_c0_g1_i1.p1  ORF type:complete len:292 (+),score=95.35 TRINITY_DN6906_c0_g1_i1:109-984(+)
MAGYIIVPSHRWQELEKSMKAGSCVLESDRHDDWQPPQGRHISMLREFLMKVKLDGPLKKQKSMTYSVGERIGYNKSGFFIHENHMRLFFGIPRAEANAMVSDEAVPVVEGDRPILGRAQTTQRLLNNLAKGMPKVDEQMREKVLRATFNAADVNGNGYLSRPELGTLLRKLVGAISAQEVEEQMKSADSSNDKGVCFKEYMEWLRKESTHGIKERLDRQMATPADIVRASFRAWDTNGDGIMTKKELYRCMSALDKGFTKDKVNLFLTAMDSDNDGKVDYDEFVDWLFYK